MKTFKGLLRELPDNGVFVFFSNIESNYSKGVAKIAKELFGADENRPPFNSCGRSYAICIKFHDNNKDIRFLNAQIDTFYRICKRDNHKLFYVMCNSTFNFHNYTINDMIKAFKSKTIPDNILFEESFVEVMNGNIVIKPKSKIIDDEI